MAAVVPNIHKKLQVLSLSSQGASGGLAYIWDPHQILLLGNGGNQGVIYMIVHYVPLNKIMLILNIYAPLQVEAKRSQWKIIENIVAAHSGLPIIIGGDFNTVLFSHEKQGGNPILDASVANMMDFIQRMHLVDIQPHNGLMTWSNRRVGVSIMGTLIASSNLVGGLKALSISSSSFFNRDKSIIVRQRLAVSFPLKIPLIIESAHKKGAGSTKNGRDSIGKRLGVKIFGDQAAKAGSIIIRQRGTKFHPGNNVGLGRDYTIFSLIDGLVKFEKYGPDKKKVSVYPCEAQPENPNSRRVKRREFFRLKREKLKAKKAGISFPGLALASAESQEPAVENAVC
ncbi:hypothetical protein KI387_035487 [Taxus chinensis]|uniref:Large ribosomal subunit protein bL27c n=1 Tax=Taxus chinensis TaxID=29808 RepID=A0AA38FNQ0_TAXCH|nr:hypothetical protein KI387_035487 [Taxus chinensis]